LNSEAVRQIVIDLEGKLAAAIAKATALQTDRRQLAFDANTGDQKARKALDTANSASATADLEIENVRSAIEEARRRLGEAERAEEMALLASNAEAALVLGERLAERGRKIDAALAIVADESKAFADDIAALNRLGCRSPRIEQFTSLGERAVSFALMFCPLKLRHLGFNERHSFTELSSTWRETVTRWASGFLDKSEAA
jgi:hypothetical protein